MPVSRSDNVTSSRFSIPCPREDTYGKGLLGIMATFAVGRKGVSQEEAEAWLAEFAELDKQGKFFFSLNRYLFVADKLATTD